ncbi:MAG: hypothetical protein RSF88_09885 [Lachnospiraceae bacterium]
MGQIVIAGIGLVNQAGTSIEEFWDSLKQGVTTEKKEPIEFKIDLPSSKLRRLNRYSKLALYAVREAQKDANLDIMDPFRIGTIFTTGYGSMIADVKFCREVIQGDPDLCSPTTFAGIVPNSCVGNVCMIQGYQGVSTVLLGGDNLQYTSILLNEKKADIIFSGAVEEYCEELFESIEENNYASGAVVREGTVMFCFTREDESKGYCKIIETSTAGLSCYPLIQKTDEVKAADTIYMALGALSKEILSEVDAVFPTENGTEFDKVEMLELEKYVEKEKIVKGVKYIVGETLGSSYNFNVAAAALCLQRGEIPKGLLHKEQAISSIHTCLVTGYDTAGNYMCSILGNIN